MQVFGCVKPVPSIIVIVFPFKWNKRFITSVVPRIICKVVCIPLSTPWVLSFVGFRLLQHFLQIHLSQKGSQMDIWVTEGESHWAVSEYGRKWATIEAIVTCVQSFRVIYLWRWLMLIWQLMFCGSHVWTVFDDARTGELPFVFDEDFGWEINLYIISPDTFVFIFIGGQDCKCFLGIWDFRLFDNRKWEVVVDTPWFWCPGLTSLQIMLWMSRCTWSIEITGGITVLANHLRSVTYIWISIWDTSAKV